MTRLTVDHFMSKSPHTIGQHQPLAVAHKMMNERGIRHLPVLDAGKLLGVVSQRDLHLIETLKDVDPAAVKVSEAMTADVYAVSPKTLVRTVAREMAEHKYGCAVVMDKEHVIGVFTTTDALRALSMLLDEQQRRSAH